MDSYAVRKNIIGLVIIVIAIIYIGKLFSIQVLDTSYQLSASNNVLRRITQYPARGLIYDRNGKLMVHNQAAYDIMVTPGRLEPFDTSEFCNILNISEKYLKHKLDSAKNYSEYKPSAVLNLVSSETYAKFQEKLYKFPGFFVQPRTVRKYRCPLAAHTMGYVGEASQALVDTNNYYKPGDYVGISGIEKAYEKELRGIKGAKLYMVDVHNRIKGPYREGRYDKNAVAGKDLTTTIDAELQRYGEKLMKNKIGSIVAIEPSTGEVLSLVSTPDYNPELLVGRKRRRNYPELKSDTLKPLFNRALMAKYPPGSTFKVLTASIALQEDVVYTGTEFSCYGGFYYGSFHVGCHSHKSPVDLIESIQVSCNAYHCNTFLRIFNNKKYETPADAMDQWEKYVKSFGFGQKLNIDLPNELPGLVPSTEYYDKIYQEGRWKPLNIISLAIGQGELGMTPLQMANMTSAIANRGHYYTPHVIKSIEGNQTIAERFKKPHQTMVDSSNLEIVIEGMDLAVNGPAGSGSTARTAAIDGITLCGKTGTAQNPHGEDHSIFIAFAPKENPKIALSVYVENGGYGSRWAAPIAKLMTEKYLNDSISVKWWENYVLDANLIQKRRDEETD